MDQQTTPISRKSRHQVFRDKTIFIISHENWGSMLLSKHHYAIELGKAGNHVFFINHPDKRKTLRRGQIQVVDSGSPKVTVIKNRLVYPYFLKYRLNWIYQYLISWHIKKIIKKIGRQPDIVWSFDSSNTFPLKCFPGSKLRILMPVDGPFGHKDEFKSAKGADVIISVTDDILKTYENLSVPKLKVEHGVGEAFLADEFHVKPGEALRVGYSGSLLRSDIDFETLLKLIRQHPQIVFEFWGEYDPSSSNIHLPQDVGHRSKDFVENLKGLSNVILHGPVSPNSLAAGLQSMDVLLICYNRDCQNSHKLLEYLGTGKVIVASRINNYVNHPDLVQMVRNENNDDYIELFNEVVLNIDSFNAVAKSEERIRFARKYSYKNNLERIEVFINQINGYP